MSRIMPTGRARVQANLTPMIDVTFLLIVFFILVSQIVDAEHVEMDLPAPVDPASQRVGDQPRVVINVVPGQDGQPIAFQLGTQRFPADTDGLLRMRDRLTSMLTAQPALHVNLRADRGADYAGVHPALQCVRQAALAAGSEARVNLNIIRNQSP